MMTSCISSIETSRPIAAFAWSLFRHISVFVSHTRDNKNGCRPSLTQPAYRVLLPIRRQTRQLVRRVHHQGPAGVHRQEREIYHRLVRWISAKCVEGVNWKSWREMGQMVNLPKLITHVYT